MAVIDLGRRELPTSDMHEAAYRLYCVAESLSEVGDDFSRQMIYDRIDDVISTLQDVVADLTDLERVIWAVVGA